MLYVLDVAQETKERRRSWWRNVSKRACCCLPLHPFNFFPLYAASGHSRPQPPTATGFFPLLQSSSPGLISKERARGRAPPRSFGSLPRTHELDRCASNFEPTPRGGASTTLFWAGSSGRGGRSEIEGAVSIDAEGRLRSNLGLAIAVAVAVGVADCDPTGGGSKTRGDRQHEAGVEEAASLRLYFRRPIGANLGHD